MPEESQSQVLTIPIIFAPHTLPQNGLYLLFPIPHILHAPSSGFFPLIFHSWFHSLFLLLPEFCCHRYYHSSSHSNKFTLHDMQKLQAQESIKSGESSEDQDLNNCKKGIVQRSIAK